MGAGRRSAISTATASRISPSLGGAGTLFVNLGLGNGTFNAVGPFTVGGGAGVPTIAMGDVNGDGKQDIVAVIAGTPNTVTVLLGDGHGGFATAPGSPFSAGGSCSEPASSSPT